MKYTLTSILMCERRVFIIQSFDPQSLSETIVIKVHKHDLQHHIKTSNGIYGLCTVKIGYAAYQMQTSNYVFNAENV